MVQRATLASRNVGLVTFMFLLITVCSPCIALPYVFEVVVTGYYSSSRRAAQTPCEDIQIRFPLPEPWVYLFRVERRFKYGSVHSATRRPGRIKGLERLTQLAQGILPPSLIEVTAGLAKYEHVFKAIVWRIDQLPERNEGMGLLKISFCCIKTYLLCWKNIFKNVKSEFFYLKRKA